MIEQNDSAGFRVYQEYMALKRHFSVDNYDYFRYNGQVKMNYESFKTKRDKYFFNKLSQNKDYKEIILANMLKNPDIWIGDILDISDGIATFKEWKKKQDSLTYILKNDIKNMDLTSFKSNFVVRNGQTPLILQLAVKKKITLETLAVLLTITNTYDYIFSKIEDEYIAKPLLMKAKKYKGFLNYDGKVVEKLISELFES